MMALLMCTTDQSIISFKRGTSTIKLMTTAPKL